MLLNADTAFAQHRPGVALPGDTVRVLTSTGFRLVGVLDRATEDIFAVTPPGGAAFLVPRSAVRSIEIKQGERESHVSVILGMATGAALGAVAFGTIGHVVDCNRSCRDFADARGGQGTAIGVALGLVGGLVLGARVGGMGLQPVWTRAALPN